VTSAQVKAQLIINGAAKIRAALVQSINAKAIVAGYMEIHPVVTDSPARDRAQARAWAIMTVNTKNDPLRQALRGIYATLYAFGLNEGKEKMAQALRNKSLTSFLNKYNEDQERDANGRWGSGGGEQAPTRQNSSPAEHIAVQDWVHSSAYETINTGLRTGSEIPGYMQDDINGLDSLIGRSPASTQETTTYRGVGGAFGEKLESMEVGDSFTDPSFVSTSSERSAAERYVSFQSSLGDPNGAVLEITNPIGSRSLDIHSYDPGFTTTNEKELLLPRDTSFTITGKENNSIQVTRSQ
jgi:hypothetical protein